MSKHRVSDRSNLARLSGMKITGDSHLDHALTPAQIDYIRRRFSNRGAFFIETLTLPSRLGTVPCGLHGPLMGDAPVVDAHMERRGGRAWDSRVCDRSPRATRKVTVIAGPHNGEPCILYTAFGGPLAPQESDDPSCKDVAASEHFWSQHALSR